MTVLDQVLTEKELPTIEDAVATTGTAAGGNNTTTTNDTTTLPDIVS
jgi:hypothetical protein